MQSFDGLLGDMVLTLFLLHETKTRLESQVLKVVLAAFGHVEDSQVVLSIHFVWLCLHSSEVRLCVEAIL